MGCIILFFFPQVYFWRTTLVSSSGAKKRIDRSRKHVFNSSTTIVLENYYLPAPRLFFAANFWDVRCTRRPWRRAFVSRRTEDLKANIWPTLHPLQTELKFVKKIETTKVGQKIYTIKELLKLKWRCNILIVLEKRCVNLPNSWGNFTFVRKFCKETYCFLEKFTLLENILHNCRSWRSRQISSLTPK